VCGASEVVLSSTARAHRAESDEKTPFKVIPNYYSLPYKLYQKLQFFAIEIAYFFRLLFYLNIDITAHIWYNFIVKNTQFVLRVLYNSEKGEKNEKEKNCHAFTRRGDCGGIGLFDDRLRQLRAIQIKARNGR